MKRKFRIGDRVSPISNTALGALTMLSPTPKGRVGIVRVIDSDAIGVQLRYPFAGHTLKGAIKTSTGFWFLVSELKLLPPR